VLALWTLSWLLGWLRRHGAGPALRAGVVVVLGAALIIPPAATAWGLSLRGGGPVGVRLVADGLAGRVTFGGQAAAVEKMCTAIPADSSVLLAGGIQDPFSQPVRGMCGLPAATVSNPTQATVRLLVAAIQRAGRRPVLLGPSPDWLAGYGGEEPRHVLGLSDDGDAHTLVAPPVHATPQRTDVWMSEFPK